MRGGDRKCHGRIFVRSDLDRQATDRIRAALRRRDFGHMNLEITLSDAKAYTRPWRIELHPHLLPDDELLEWICLEGNRGMEHMVGR
jgi:hypothetical protein